MKEAIGGAWLFGLVITFVMFFSGYISISLNYSKVYRVKDEIIVFLQNYNGLNEDSVEAISEYVNMVGYRNYGNCEANTNLYNRNCFVGIDTRDTDVYNRLTDVNYCVQKINVSDNSAYYQVTLFFAIDLPVVRNMFALDVKGETSVLMSPDEVNVLGNCE